MRCIQWYPKSDSSPSLSVMVTVVLQSGMTLPHGLTERSEILKVSVDSRMKSSTMKSSISMQTSPEAVEAGMVNVCGPLTKSSLSVSKSTTPEREREVKR